MSSFANWFSSLGKSIASIPQLMLEGIKDLFIPKEGVIEMIFESMIDELSMKFGIQTYDMGQLFQQELAVSDVKGDYTLNGVGTLNATFFDSKYLVKGVGYFRPYIRGFMVLMLVFYNLRMLLSTLGINYAMHIGKTGGTDDN